MFNIAKKKIGWETFWDSVKFTWDSTFVVALVPRDAIEIKPKSNTALYIYKDFSETTFIVLKIVILTVLKYECVWLLCLNQVGKSKKGNQITPSFCPKLPRFS